jgi:16S rRNA (adenine1518-N6/adenine1519-N6)-dimethyltransferase|tara:strand:+ start:1046 stop:1819 length:774 start_codon:yes stop_codon:yes gene_type:complete
MLFAKKSLGQNFLTDLNIINKIINIKNINKRNVIEIGPGKGALTDKILKNNPKSLLIIEKDINLYKILKGKYKNNKIIEIYNSDVLNFNFEKLTKNKSVIFGNLPYNISTQILVNLIKSKIWPPNYSDLIFMFQKEVAEKIIGKSYGRLSVISDYRLNFKSKFEVSPNCFFPKPKVKSLVVHLQPKKSNIYKIKNLKNLEYVTNIFFSNKRKMINKGLRKILSKKQFDNLRNINLKLRPSDLKPELYYKIVQLYEGK